MQLQRIFDVVIPIIPVGSNIYSMMSLRWRLVVSDIL